MRSVREFVRGLKAHGEGMRFAFANKRYLPLLLVPFALTLLLYSAGFYVFTLYVEQILDWIWAPAASEATGFMATLRWLYEHLLAAILYVLLFVIMYFAYMLIANILASPLYDVIAERIGKRKEFAALRTGKDEGFGILRTVFEELKKAVYLLVLPLLLFFVPVIGAPLSALLAMLLLAWDFVDFSLARDEPSFKGRLAFVRRHPFLLLGFGLPLLAPFVNILFYPFAIVGGSLLYQKQLHLEQKRS